MRMYDCDSRVLRGWVAGISVDSGLWVFFLDFLQAKAKETAMINAIEATAIDDSQYDPRLKAPPEVLRGPGIRAQTEASFPLFFPRIPVIIWAKPVVVVDWRERSTTSRCGHASFPELCGAPSSENGGHLM